MQLIVLGSGTSVPHAHRSAAAYWLQTELGALLLDVGPDTPHRMAQEKLDWPNLDAIWVSHFHLDHVGGLAPFLFGAKWAPQMHDRRKPLRIYGPSGLAPLLDAINDANNYKLLEQVFPVEIREVAAGEHFETLPGLFTTTQSTPHTSESLAIRLTDRSGKVFVYTSDTGFSEKLIEFARGADLLLLECSFRRNKPMPTHLDLAEAMLLIKESQPETAVLTHLYPEWDDMNVAHEAGSLPAGRVLEAVDGLRLEF